MKVLELRGIKREYRLGDGKKEEGALVRALRGVDFSAGAGEFISIMGPSGSGKSTLMNILGCLDKPSAGTYRIDGIETASSDSDTFALIRNKKIGFVFQAFNLLARTTALENVELPLFYDRPLKRKAGGGTRAGSPAAKAAWRRGAARRERAAAALREVGLGERMHHVPSQLSGGQQQRVAIARAIVNDPAFILADEPTGNLDTEMTLEIMTLFQALNGRGKTIVMVTHEPELAAYTRRIVTLRDGLLVSDIPVKERRSAAADFAAWKQEHRLLAGGGGAGG
ncbi:MAG: ABC transporter ATP-binding protein [Treponema sp.]|jgi:putative ABC transport system ATP-binding protein|nr:ABC transporter ATP-binding protein [Treponema sp.]